MPPRSHSSLSLRGKHQGTSKCIPEGGDQHTHPGVTQVKSIGHSHTFNKTDLSLLSPHAYQLWSSPLQQTPQNPSSPNPGPRFPTFCRCLWFAGTKHSHQGAFPQCRGLMSCAGAKHLAFQRSLQDAGIVRQGFSFLLSWKAFVSGK